MRDFKEIVLHLQVARVFVATGCTRFSVGYIPLHSEVLRFLVHCACFRFGRREIREKNI